MISSNNQNFPVLLRFLFDLISIFFNGQPKLETPVFIGITFNRTVVIFKTKLYSFLFSLPIGMRQKKKQKFKAVIEFRKIYAIPLPQMKKTRPVRDWTQTVFHLLPTLLA